MSDSKFTIELGVKAKDKITSFEGIVVIRAEHLFGCNTYGIAPDKLGTDGKKIDTEWFDEGRIEVVSEGVKVADVQAAKKGSEFREYPKSKL